MAELASLGDKFPDRFNSMKSREAFRYHPLYKHVPRFKGRFDNQPAHFVADVIEYLLDPVVIQRYLRYEDGGTSQPELYALGPLYHTGELRILKVSGGVSGRVNCWTLLNGEIFVPKDYYGEDGNVAFYDVYEPVGRFNELEGMPIPAGELMSTVARGLSAQVQSNIWQPEKDDPLEIYGIYN